MSKNSQNITSADTVDEVEELFEEPEEAALQEIKKKSVSGAISYVFRTLLLYGVSVATTGILSGLLKVEDFGIYGYVTQFVGLFVFFSDIGLSAALVQKKTEPSETDYRTAFTVQQILSVLILVGFIVLAMTGIVQQKTGPVGTWLLIALGLSFPLASLKTIPSILLERELDFNKLVLPQVFEQLVYNGILIFFALRGQGVQSFAYAIIARSVVGLIVMYILRPWKPGFALAKDSLKNLIGFGAKFQLNDLLARVKDQFFYIALVYMMPLKDFGYVQWTKTISMYPYNFTVSNVIDITFPTFSRLQNNKEALAKAIDKATFFITLLIFPLVVGMSIFVFPLVRVIPHYQQWQPAVWSLVLFSLSIAWSAVSTPLTNTLNAIGHINTNLKLMVMWTALTWVLTPLFVWWWGFNGVAIAAFVISFSSVLSVWAVARLVKIHTWANSWRQVVACLAMVAVSVPFINVWSRSIPWMVVGMLVAGGAYGASFLLVGRHKLIAELQSLRHKKVAAVSAAGA